MKDICAIYLKEEKAIIKKLVSKLESDGISCWVPPRDFHQEDIEAVKKVIINSNILLLALNNNTSKNKQIIDILEVALDNGLDVIPFVTGKIDSDLYSEYFFYQFSWVDAYEDEFDEAYEVLLEAIDDSSDGKTRKTTSNKKTTSSNINKQWYYAIIAIALVIIGYFSIDFFTENEKENVLIGEWHLSDYSDNLKRAPQDSINIYSQIEVMKKTAMMIFNEDKSFERRGFSPEPQIGEWEIVGNAEKLHLTPLGSKVKNIMDIETFTDKILVLVINEKLPRANADSVEVHTKLTFSK